MKNFLKSLFVISLVALVCACSKDDSLNFSNPSKFKISNYALDLSHAQGLAVSNDNSRGAISGNLYVYDENNQLQPINLRVSDEFKIDPDSVYPDYRIGLDARVYSQFKLGDFYVFNGVFEFYDTKSEEHSGYVAHCLLVDIKTGTLYEYPGRDGLIPSFFGLIAGDCQPNGVMYVAERNGFGNALVRLIKDGRNLKLDQLLPDNESADIVHVDKYDNVLYRLDRIRMANGRIVPLPETGTAFVAADGQIYTMPYFTSKQIYRFENGNLVPVNTTNTSVNDFVMEGKENVDKINVGTKTFLIDDSNIDVFDVSDCSLRSIANLIYADLRVATEKYYFLYSNRDHHLYRFDYETESLEQLEDEYQFYDLLPYGNDQAQFHGMRYADGHEVYGIIDINGNIRIQNENGQFRSVVVQPL